MRKRKSILYVEDDFGSRSALPLILKDGEYEIHTAEDGIEGLRKLQESAQPYDLIITGIAMPGMDGDEMVSIIRETNMDTPILVISGGRYERGCELIKQGLVSACLPKPFGLDEVVNIVKLLLNNRFVNLFSYNIKSRKSDQV